MRFEVFFFAVTTLAGNIVHERRVTHNGLERGQRVKGDSVMRFNFGLKQRNLENAERYLLNISDPRSPHYGKLWSREQVERTFAPSPESVQLVREWLRSEGMEDVHEAKGWLSFSSPVERIEKLLNAAYHEHHDPVEPVEIRIGCDQYSLPEHISKHVDYITPGITLSVPLEKREISESSTLTAADQLLNPKKSRDRIDSQPDEQFTRSSNTTRQLENCGATMTPACIRALYGIPSPAEVASEYSSGVENSLGIFEMAGTYNQSDLDTWFSKYAPEIPKGTHPIPAPINNAKVNQQETSEETALDFMEAYGIIYPQKITQYQTKTRPRQTKSNTRQGQFEVFQDLLDALDGSFCTERAENHNQSCGIYTPTNVVSISYGGVEISESQASVHRLCNEFAKLALQGTTFTVGSGDYGVGVFPGSVGKQELVENGCIVRGDYNASIANYPSSGKGVRNGTIFNSQFPASCPYVLSVGATMLPQNETVSGAESAMLIPKLSSPSLDISLSSGGGFSNWFSRPLYQSEAIRNYFSNHDPGYPFYRLQNGSFDDIGANGGVYNRAGRGIPDVSANGVRFPIILDGDLKHVWGTSCAAPIWASIITLINEKRSQAGKGPVGFINPTLYQHPEVFNDITTGSNYGCFSNGFSAVEGWDPITGLGTPNFPKLLELFMSLP